MSALSDYLNAHIPEGWSRRDVVRALASVLDQSTVYRYLGGNHTAAPPEHVLQAFAAALPATTIVELREAAGLAAGEEEPWILPPEAQRLNRAQRAVIEQLIRVFVAGPDPAHERAGKAGAGKRPMSAREAQTQEYVQQLRQLGQHELAERLEAALGGANADSGAASNSPGK